jgi:hypothetical protein
MHLRRQTRQLVALLLALGAALAPCAAAGAPKSMMVDPTSILVYNKPYVVRTWLKTICDKHRTKGSSNYIFNLVVMETGRKKLVGGQWLYEGSKNTAVLDTAGLDLIEDYYGCFDNIFVGTAVIPTSNPYAPGGDMASATHRWDKIILPSRLLAQAYDARYKAKFGSKPLHWYISYEANLNYFTSAALRGQYAATFNELIKDFKKLRPGASIMWSPNFWTKYASLGTSAKSSLQSALTDFFTRWETAGLNWVHFQDFVGASSYHNCSTGGISYGINASNAIGYYGLLNQAAGSALSSLRVNMELFRSTKGACNLFSCCAVGDKAEHASREAAYTAAGVPVGASFELRYWYPALYGPTGTACNKAETCNGNDDDCDLKVDEGLPPKSCGTDVGLCTKGTQTCSGGAWSACSGVGPGAETCNGKDDDCDGATDEGCTCVVGAKRGCGTDVGVCTKGTQTCSGGVWSACSGVGPGAETCNGKDDDCDGATDEACASPDAGIAVDAWSAGDLPTGDLPTAVDPPGSGGSAGCCRLHPGDDPSPPLGGILLALLVVVLLGRRTGAK